MEPSVVARGLRHDSGVRRHGEHLREQGLSHVGDDRFMAFRLLKDMLPLVIETADA